MTSPALSVVIPTRNRRETLMTTLRALGSQRDLEGRFEVIVVDDGSTDDTVNRVRGSVFEAFDHQVIALSPGGPARARNRGIGEARADRVLLLGDDTVPTPLALAGHLKLGRGGELAVQGRIDWDCHREITDVMAFLAPAGPQFWFSGLRDREPVPWPQMLGSNLSAPTSWFRDEPFDEVFTDACMEDTELAWRWRKRGRRTVWSEQALCHHHHRYDDIETFVERQLRTGYWARVAVGKHWGMLRKLVLEPVVMLAWKTVRTERWRLAGRGRDRDRWDLQCRRAYLRGLFRGR
jgi:glycosyltransferase involved in cell wall biosynthesis